MSRSNTPSVLSSLTAYGYDSSSDEEAEAAGDESDLNLNPREKGQGQVTVLLPPTTTSAEPSTNQNQKQHLLSVAHHYDDEENFDYHRSPPEDDEDEEKEEDANSDDQNDNKDLSNDGSSTKTETERDMNMILSNDEDKSAEDTDNTEEGEPLRKKSRREKYPWLFTPTKGECPPKIQEHFAKLFAAKLKGTDINTKIQQIKEIRNPSIYEKLIDICGIDEHGTNFPDRPQWDPSSYYDELDKAQRLEMERRLKEKERKTKELKEAVKVDFVSGTVKKPDAAVKPFSTVVSAASAVPKQPSAYIRAFGNLTFKN